MEQNGGFSMEDLQSFAEYLRLVGDVFQYILEQNRKMGNTCMELSKFTQRASRYAFLEKENIPCYLRFFIDKVICFDGLVGLREDYEKDIAIRQRVAERRNRHSLISMRTTVNVRLNAEQKLAVEEAPHTDISIITGGAGTGKTTIINQMLRNFNHTYRGEKKAFVLTPTGKAARRARETIEEACSISTVHYFAGWGHPLNRRDYQRIRSADFIIVDEVSMLSASMFCLLMQITDAPVVLVGDVNQLPAVEAGNILKDLIGLGVPTYYLKVNYRSDDDILSNAGIFLSDNGFRGLIASENFRLVKVKEDEVTEMLMSESTDIILTPYRKEDIPGSCTCINQRMHERHGYQRGYFRAGEPVIIMESNTKAGYANGETGYVTAVTAGEIYVDLGDRVVTVRDERDIDLNYACTIHKAQGSEYDSIALYCPNTSILTRNMLYTAITRAKHRVTIYYTDDMVFEQAYKRNAYTRSTFLSGMAA